MIELRRRYSGGVQSPSFSRLPAGYQEVEWIRPIAKGAYIDTGIIPNDNLDFNVKFSAYVYDGIQMIFGTKNPQYRIYFASASNAIESQFPKWGTYYWISENAGFGVYTFSKEGTLFKLNDLYYNYAISGIESTSHIYLFNSSNESNYYSTNYLYYAAFKDNGVIVREFIPCYRISDRKPGMYDIVNDVFYTNVGTGEFLYGPDVHYNIPPEYQQVEYLESTGTQYIVTNIKPKYGDSYDFTALISVIGNSHSYATIITPLRFGSGDAGTNIYKGQFVVQANGIYRITAYQMFNSHVKKKVVYKWGEKYSAFIYQNDELAYAWEEDNTLSNREIDAYLPIFCYYDNGKYSEFATMQMYEFNYYREDKIIAKLIPCYRKADDEAGMYDLVSGEFYTNAGTGEFIVGPDVIG